MLREVHGRPQLHRSKVEDVGSTRGHHCRHLLPARLRVRGRVLRTRHNVVASKELMAIREEIDEEMPDPKQSAGSFEPIEGAKEVLIDPSGSKGKVVCIGAMLSSE